MAYEVFLLPVADGADVEEAGEALLARLAGAEEAPDVGAPDPAVSAVTEALRVADPALHAAPDRPAPAAGGRVIAVTWLRDAAGIDVTVTRSFARFRVPFHHRGADAESAFDRLFRLLGAASAVTGWRAYDPQDAAAVVLDAEGRDATLEIYLSAMDQIRPAPPGARGSG